MNDWIKRNSEYTLTEPQGSMEISCAGMKFSSLDLEKLSPMWERVRTEMLRIESGEIKNPDENRKVTHFTDRKYYPETDLFNQVEVFADSIRSGKLRSSSGKHFTAVAVNGIGGSALGPQLMQFAINGPYWNEFSQEKRNGNLKIYFLDNTDSSGFADLLKIMDPETTIQLVVSKSGGTQETKNNMIAMENFYAAKNCDFSKVAVAITMQDSQLYRHATENKWLQIFEMADSVGGRTSETAIVGHVPAALTGINFRKFLAGATAMDEWTSKQQWQNNPAYLLAAMWFIAGEGKGNRNMVIVPYSDRLVLLSRYLQQLVMESLGKELDLNGKIVHQGLNVFGNKGGTDAHAFIQQLNDGRDDFFATFIEILKDAEAIELTPGVFMGDYLHAFQEGLSSALRAKGRQTITIRLPKLTVYELGQIIALYERAVAVYAEFININAFHQPGVQAYKLAAKGVLELREKLVRLTGNSGNAQYLATLAGVPEQAVEVGHWLDKLAANNRNVSRKYDSAQGCWIYNIDK